ncbi:MAG: beta-galactosidase [Chloroflexi bacterium]|nr:beta-galactosidase [Chloroflexota bacterium]
MKIPRWMASPRWRAAWGRDDLRRHRLTLLGARSGPRRPSRRFSLVLALTSAALLLLLARNHPALGQVMQVTPTEPPNVGLTFSKRQAEYLGLPWRETFQMALNLSPQLVRLGAYWDEIESQPGHYDFSTLDWQLDQAAAQDRQVMLTVGMKAPRWPEYYLPTWLMSRLTLPQGAQVSDSARLRTHALAFVRTVVQRYRSHEVIAYWQVENEPLDPSGPHRWRIGADFLRQEVELVRALDEQRRPVIVNMFVATHPLNAAPPLRTEVRKRARTILETADILGLDLYPSMGTRILGFDVYFNWLQWPWERPALDLQRLARQHGKETWIIEAQAEPWEPSSVVYTAARQSRSVQPSTAVSIFGRLQAAGFQHILLWGVEHWYMRLQRYRDGTWWEAMEPHFPQGAG